MTDHSEPPTWLIVTGIIVTLSLVFLLGVGYGQQWGANQWGPVAAWLSGAATLAAVVVALRQADIARRESMDLQVARLVDHEVSRRRECIQAVSDLWAAIVSMTIEFRTFTDWLDNLPQSFAGNRPRTDGERPGEPYYREIERRFVTFYDRWAGIVQPPLFVALAVLYGTDMYGAVEGINDSIVKMSKEDTEGGFIGIRKQLIPDPQHGFCYRPDTDRLNAMWHDIGGRRYAHLQLMQKHFSLARDDVEKAVRGAGR
jgi:hypothetical protein